MIPGIPEGAAGSHLFDYLLRSFPQFPGFVKFVLLLLYICYLLCSLFNLLYLQASTLFLSIQFYPVFYPSLLLPFLFHILIHSITTLRPSTYSSSSSSSTIFPPLLLPSTLAPEVPYSVVRCLVTPSPCDDARMLRRATTRKNG